MPVMRAKFVIDAVAHHEGADTLQFRAIGKNDCYDADGLDENSTFSAFTPSADLRMVVNNPALVGKFKAGQQFYVDFTEAE